MGLSWSPQKINYCCKNFHKGCKGEERASMEGCARLWGESGVVRCLGGQYQASRFFLCARALKRDTVQGIPRHITLLLSEGKDTPRCEHDIFGRIGPSS